ncbi:hypothetical protein B5X24_HaOG211390 [Helicoverpa armigera]|nr:hypothetical protein B5X24_HaOG211390 [Helicoverpa armigera]
MEFFYITVLLQMYYVAAEIRTSKLVNKLSKVKPVGGHVDKNFMPLTEIPPPKLLHPPHGTGVQSGRRHMEEECTKKPKGVEVNDGAKVGIYAEYYDDNVAKTMATIIFPDHIDRRHFEVTTQVPYLTVGPIEALGYHPSTMKSEHPSECEKIYQDHLDDQYSEESKDYSEESLEMARMPLFPDQVPESLEDRLGKMYSDLDM